MMRGLVLERRGRHAIVLLPGGEIRRVPAPGASTGDEILLPAQVRRAPSRRFGYAVAALALVLAVLPAELPFAQAKVVAYATVDINPSVELGLSAGGTVLTSHALDADGRRVLATASVRGEPLSDAVASLLRVAQAQGFMSAAQPAAVIVAGYGSGAQALPQAVQVQLRSARSLASGFLRRHGLHGVVSAMIVPRVLVQAATRAHVSAGVYAVWSALHNAGAKVRVGAMRGSDLGTAMAKIATTASGRSVLPLLTGKPVQHGKGIAPSTGVHGVHGGGGGGSAGSATRPTGATGASGTQPTGATGASGTHPTGVTSGQGAQPGGSTSGQGTQPGGTTEGQGAHTTGAASGQGTQTTGATQHPSSGASVQVQILVPGGTLQLQLGGDSQESGDTPGVPQGGAPSGHGDGSGQGGHGRQGHGAHGRGDGTQGQGVLPGGTFPQGSTGGGAQGQGGTNKEGQGPHGRGAGGMGQGVLPSGTFPQAPSSGDGTQWQGQGQGYGQGDHGFGHAHGGDGGQGSGDQQPGGGQGGFGGAGGD